MEGEVEWNLPRADAISGNGHLTAGNGEKKEGRERVAWGKRDAVVQPGRGLGTE